MTTSRPLSRAASAERFDWGWLLAMSSVLCLVLLASNSYSAVQRLIQAEWALGDTEAGIIFSAYQAGYVAATLLMLPLTDRVSARRVIVLSAAAATLGNALFPLFAQDLTSAALLRAVAGLGLVGVYMPGLRVVAERFSGQRRGLAVGIYVASFYLGTSFSFLVTGLLVPVLEWRGAYLVAALLAAPAAAIALFVLRGAQPTGVTGSGRLSPAVFTNRPAMLAIAAYTAHTWELYVARAWIAPFLGAVLVARGLGEVEAVAEGAAAAAAMMGAGTVGVALGGGLSDRFGRIRTAAAIAALSGLCSFAFGWLGGVPWPLLIAVGLLYGFAIGADSPVYSSAVVELARPGQLGSTQAVQSFVGFGGSVIGPVVFGALLDLAGPALGWGLGFSTAGLTTALGLAAWLALGRSAAARKLAGGRG